MRLKFKTKGARRLFILTTAVSIGLGLNASAFADDDPISDSPNFQTIRSTQTISQNDFDIFRPKLQTKNTRFDFTLWDGLLGRIVVPFGPSLRRIAKKPKPLVGSKFIRGNRSKYRLEGNKVAYSRVSSEFFDAVTDYRGELVRIANEQDFQSFNRDEQLAFWFNLHNVILIDEIAKVYPVEKPSSQIKYGADELPLHEAKLVTIKGVHLSLRDIRENIVYKNWSNPDVIYGFTHGDIGGPAIFVNAFSADNLAYGLDHQASEYVNSLRGVQARYNDRRISRIYAEARPYFFNNWPADVETHIRKHAEDDTLEDINENRPLQFVDYDETLADLWGGKRRFIPPGPVQFVNDTNATLRLPPILKERTDKFRELIRKGYFDRDSEVIIEDVPAENAGSTSFSGPNP